MQVQKYGIKMLIKDLYWSVIDNPVYHAVYDDEQWEFLLSKHECFLS